MADNTVCPQCGGALVADHPPPVREMVKAMVQRGSSATYAQNFAEQHHEKRQSLGALQVCSTCRYVTRQGKHKAAPAAAPA